MSKLSNREWRAGEFRAEGGSLNPGERMAAGTTRRTRHVLPTSPPAQRPHSRPKRGKITIVSKFYKSIVGLISNYMIATKPTMTAIPPPQSARAVWAALVLSDAQRESNASRFCSLQTRFNGACAVGCEPEPFSEVRMDYIEWRILRPVGRSGAGATKGGDMVILY